MTVVLTPRGSIIPAAEFGQIHKAEELLASAKRALSAAKVEADLIREDARREGFAQGREQGLREALERIGGAIASLEGQLLDQEERIERVVLRAVELIIGALEPDEGVRRLLRHAISEAADTGPISLHVSAEEVELVRRAAKSVIHQAEILIDPLLAPGEIVLETAVGRSHIGAREQVAALAEEMRRG